MPNLLYILLLFCFGRISIIFVKNARISPRISIKPLSRQNWLKVNRKYSKKSPFEDTRILALNSREHVVYLLMIVKEVRVVQFSHSWTSKVLFAHFLIYVNAMLVSNCTRERHYILLIYI